MTREIKMSKTKDGRVFHHKTAANRYERGLLLGEKLDAMGADKKTTEFIKENWKRLGYLNQKHGNVTPYEEVADQKLTQNDG